MSSACRLLQLSLATVFLTFVLLVSSTPVDDSLSSAAPVNLRGRPRGGNNRRLRQGRRRVRPGGRGRGRTERPRTRTGANSASDLLALQRAAQGGLTSQEMLERFAPGTPSPQDVNCHIEIQTTRRIGGQCVQLGSRGNHRACQSGIYLDIWTNQCSSLDQSQPDRDSGQASGGRQQNTGRGSADSSRQEQRSVTQESSAQQSGTGSSRELSEDGQQENSEHSQGGETGSQRLVATES